MNDELSPRNPFTDQPPSEPSGSLARTDQMRGIAEVQAALVIATGIRYPSSLLQGVRSTSSPSSIAC